MHPDYASFLNNIGNTYDSKGDYDKALEYKLKSVEIRKIVLG
jgi:nephrocystin-3